MPDIIIYVIVGILSGIAAFIFINISSATGVLKIEYNPDYGYSLSGLILGDYTIEELAKRKRIILTTEVETIKSKD